jgi:glucans biosynthesis protein
MGDRSPDPRPGGPAFGRAVAAAFALAGALLASTAQAAFGYDDVTAIARRLAAQPWKQPADRLPPELRDLEYDALRDIRFKPEAALWRNEHLPFELQFMHMGRAVREPIAIHTIDPSGVHDVPFDPTNFDYGQNRFDPRRFQGLGYAGFRVHHALNGPAYKDEVLVFHGASYFRALGRHQIYGLSARGLAIDTAAASGEEFPRFSEFWIERPRRGAASLVIHALLDSRRATGAYRFVLTPGVDTTLQVTARLFLRDAIGKLGLAPLTSMYLFGENQPGRDDYRPEVHDSDGLLMQSADGEWIWRPLVNPRRLLVTSFAFTSPKGFGLLQRDRAATSYEDPESLFERRPSAWVEPLGEWGAGRVELVQIPTPDETNDNIVAYWVPAKSPAAGQPLELAYRLHWLMQGPAPDNLAWVTQSRRGRGYVKQADGDLQFVVDFDGPPLRALPPDATGLAAAVTVDPNAELHERNLYRNAETGAWRMTLRFHRLDASRPVELRARLERAGEPLSETWSYILPPEADKP